MDNINLIIILMQIILIYIHLIKIIHSLLIFFIKINEVVIQFLAY